MQLTPIKKGHRVVWRQLCQTEYLQQDREYHCASLDGVQNRTVSRKIEKKKSDCAHMYSDTVWPTYSKNLHSSQLQEETNAMQFIQGRPGVGAVRRRGCLTLTWRCRCRGSPCRSCVLSGRRCCSSPAPPWWRTPCRRPSAGRPSGFPRCCRTGCCADSSASSEPPGPERTHLNYQYYTVVTFEFMVYNSGVSPLVYSFVK